MKKNTYCLFTLSMPSKGSRSGKRSGENSNYYEIRAIYGEHIGKLLLDGKNNMYYNFGDGRCANIEIKLIDKKEALKLKNKSDGFCGYNRMIDSIIDNGFIKKPQ